MRLLVGQLPIKAKWRDATLVVRDFSESNKQTLSANVAISLHSYPHFHQLILPILSWGVKLISSSQYKMLLRNSLTRLHIKWFQRNYLFNNHFFNILRVFSLESSQILWMRSGVYAPVLINLHTQGSKQKLSKTKA